jgi:hypothetical protein
VRAIDRLRGPCGAARRRPARTQPSPGRAPDARRPDPPTSATTTGSASSTGGSGSTTQAAGEIPDETAGPYPGDGSNGPDILEQSRVVRSDIRASTSLTGDNVCGEDGAASQLATMSGDVDSGFIVALPVAVDTTTAPTGGSIGGGAGGGPGGPPPTN